MRCIFIALAILTSTAAHSQEFFCSIRTQIGLLEDNGKWEGSANLKLPEYLSSGIIIRPPNQEDKKQIKQVHRDQGWENYPFIVYNVAFGVVTNACDRGFSNSGYLFCDSVSELVFNFNSSRFKMSDVGTFLSNKKFEDQHFADVYSYGDCIRR